MKTYEEKVAYAIYILESIPQDGPIEVSYSGGKDSDVILELAKMAGIPFEAVYKNTSVDPSGTVKHAKDNGVTVLAPKMTMTQIIEKNGWPTRRARFCCGILKEYSVHRRAVQGIRRSESVARAKRYQEPEVCREYGRNDKVRIYLPILEWTDADVERFIKERNIQCHPLYYDEEGKFHVERRLGCIGCPMQYDNGRADFKKYPKMLKAWVNALKKWWDTHPNARSHEKFGNVYNLVYHNLFCRSYEDFLSRISPSLFADNQVIKEYLEQYFNVEL